MAAIEGRSRYVKSCRKEERHCFAVHVPAKQVLKDLETNGISYISLTIRCEEADLDSYTYADISGVIVAFAKAKAKAKTTCSVRIKSLFGPRKQNQAVTPNRRETPQIIAQRHYVVPGHLFGLKKRR